MLELINHRGPDEKGIINQQLNQEVLKIQSQLKIPLKTDASDPSWSSLLSN